VSGLPAAYEIASAVRSGDLTAEAVTRTALSQIERMDPALRCFTSVHRDRALRDARALDARIRRGEAAGPLAGVPFGVKDLYDVAGTVTLAGSRILRDNAPAAWTRCWSAAAAAGAVLLGCQNMDEFAYGFTTENSTTAPRAIRTTMRAAPADPPAAPQPRWRPVSCPEPRLRYQRLNRVPASFCGVFGLKPTYGRLPARERFRSSTTWITWAPGAHRDGSRRGLRCHAGYDAGDQACADAPTNRPFRICNRTPRDCGRPSWTTGSSPAPARLPWMPSGASPKPSGRFAR